MRVTDILLSTIALASALVPSAVSAAPANAGGRADAPADETQQFDAEKVVAEARRLIGEQYVVRELRSPLDKALADGLASGRYRVDQPALLAERMNADLARVGQDHHLYIRYQPERFAAMSARTNEDQPDMSLVDAEARRKNHGIRELKLLPGNVRYLDISSFEWVEGESEAVINAAMQFLKGGDAVIIDVRRNGGGNGRAVHQVVGHFLPAGKPLITFKTATETMPFLTSLDGLSTMIGKPLYLLTSRATGSAAEELAGHVAGYRIGEVVGSATSGAAFMNRLFPIPPGFILSVSAARPVLAATGGDWERTGVAPTIATPPESALEAAHLHAVRTLAIRDAPRRSRLEALASGLQALASPGKPALNLQAYRGSFGGRRISIEAGALWMQVGEEPRRRLVSMGGNAFTFADDPGSRLTFEAKGGRAIAFGIGPAGGQIESRFERSR